MQIRYILKNMRYYLTFIYGYRSKNDLDGKYWIQGILLKNHLKSLNKSD